MQICQYKRIVILQQVLLLDIIGPHYKTRFLMHFYFIGMRNITQAIITSYHLSAKDTSIKMYKL